MGPQHHPPSLSNCAESSPVGLSLPDPNSMQQEVPVAEGREGGKQRASWAPPPG